VSVTAEVFGEYGSFYDLLYANKESDREADYVATLIRSHAPAARSLLDLGCGTGRHGCRMAARGYEVVGVERSARMLEAARASAAALGSNRFVCIDGDACTVELGRTFDAISALFHVVSYQTRDDELRALFENVERHLAPGGCFVFDVWHADAVLALRPEVRVARRESETLRLTRIAEPTLDAGARVVEVAYTMFIESKQTDAIRRIEERHRLRYFSREEIEQVAAGAGFRLVESEEWLTKAPPSAQTWGVCYVAVRAAGPRG
jgi:SAM-dependent methyltransferase